MRDLGEHENMAMKCGEVGALNLGCHRRPQVQLALRPEQGSSAGDAAAVSFAAGALAHYAEDSNPVPYGKQPSHPSQATPASAAAATSLRTVSRETPVPHRTARRFLPALRQAAGPCLPSNSVRHGVPAAVAGEASLASTCPLGMGISWYPSWAARRLAACRAL